MSYVQVGQTVHTHPTDPAAREAERAAAIASREAMRGKTKVRVATEAQMRAAVEKSAAFKAAREAGVTETLAPAGEGTPMTTWLLIGGGLLAAVFVVKRLRRKKKT